ncbi:MAG: hypothetical protein ACK53Y_26755 [bacterium]
MPARTVTLRRDAFGVCSMRGVSYSPPLLTRSTWRAAAFVPAVWCSRTGPSGACPQNLLIGFLLEHYELYLAPQPDIFLESLQGSQQLVWWKLP